MNIKTLEVNGFAPAMYAMRAPMKSWNKSDSKFKWVEDDLSTPHECYTIGEKDKELSMKLQKAGTEHCKHLRMIQVWADITGPREWLIQLDTYRLGVEKVSTSTMHTLMKRPLTEDDFEHDCMNDKYMHDMLDAINSSMEVWKHEENPIRKAEIWRGIIEALPQSFLQQRVYMFSYAALRNIVKQREGHKLHEWKTFIDWVRTLPEANWMIFDEE